MSSKQKLVILFAVLLMGLLYFAPKQPSEQKQDEASGSADFTALFEQAKKKSTQEQQAIYDRLDKGLTKAKASNKEEDWAASASDFLRAAHFVKDDNTATLYRGAINGYEKVLALNPGNLSAKTSLGTAIVESASMLGNPPMKGITLLREVLKADSNNIEANLQLGLFSVTSQQFDKAVERYKKILRIDSSRIDMYVLLGDAYLNKGDRSKAIESYESYKTRVKDTLIEKDIDQRIKELKIN